MDELKHIRNIESGIVTGVSFVQTGDCTTASSNFDPWSNPCLIDTIVNEDSIELVYRQDSLITYTIDWVESPSIKIFKVVYSCKKGKWHKSEPIEGSYISATDERYEF